MQRLSDYLNQNSTLTWQKVNLPALDGLQFKKAAPRKRLFGLTWEYDRREPRFERFGVSDGCRGVSRHANPATAYLALRRWRKAAARPS
ncbi:hypothetical protein EDD33_2664 [Nocardioides aurantiacus]|uniref:Uncharacterized protein n=2 Tax=Nocardioides aurantiacus TaxID=86796 RepID=A0A3N2CWB6_9ACTN|nr:hypothetical protein EDD33_2664 [Nocardioides aurantiacus]